jgi:type II secretory pathway pseudopilin PulG
MSRRGRERFCAGFTIIELAVALFLMALLFGGVFVPLKSQVEQRKVDETGRVLEKAREALLGYAATRGYFPCPADAASGGQEAAGSDHASGDCPAYHGFLPAVALGLTSTDANGYALDAWGTAASRIRYAVAKQGTGSASNMFTRVNGMRGAGISSMTDSALSLLHVCGRAKGVSAGVSCGTAPTLVSTAPVVIWSTGANAATGGTSADEAQNPNANGGSADRIFVTRVASDVPGSEFDDIVAWIPMPILIGRMVAAGQLP